MASSREKILSALKPLKSELAPLPTLKKFDQTVDRITQFTEVLQRIGGKVYQVNSHKEVIEKIQNDFGEMKRIISSLPEFSSVEKVDNNYEELLTSLHDVDLFITQSTLGVAENGAVWLSEQEMHKRVLPFITKHLAVVIDHHNIVNTMYEAYQKIGTAEYGFASFIAGPSKTADIEQSLVLGAHGAITMHVFILKLTSF